jgi:alkanesulfonate monooxygenase SsuD/methylene tetrahydromethanopterin reductase-like flavin-dependent oxidoreductase (luciferase family)
MEIGLYTFADITPNPQTRVRPGYAQRMGEVLSAAKLADEVGLSVYGVGEHHRLDMAASSPAVVLAAIAAATRKVRLTSTVTILPTLDPVRVYQDFATLDLVSGGRAEITVGRGAFTESFPLFGVDMQDYDAVFAEKLDLLRKLDAAERVTWSGKYRTPIENAEISPRPANGALPIWIGVGGTLESAVRAGRLCLPLTLANITLPPAKLAPQIEAYRQAAKEEAGQEVAGLRVAIAGHLYVAKDSKKARDEFYPHYAAYFREHAVKGRYAMEITREEFDKRAAPDGPLYVGSPQEIVDKIGRAKELFRHDRYLGQMDLGGVPFSKVAEATELLAHEVMPRV